MKAFTPSLATIAMMVAAGAVQAQDHEHHGGGSRGAPAPAAPAVAAPAGGGSHGGQGGGFRGQAGGGFTRPQATQAQVQPQAIPQGRAGFQGQRFQGATSQGQFRTQGQAYPQGQVVQPQQYRGQGGAVQGQRFQGGSAQYQGQTQYQGQGRYQGQTQYGGQGGNRGQGYQGQRYQGGGYGGGGRGFNYRGGYHNAFRATPYRFPGGYGYRRYSVRQIFPSYLLLDSYYLNDWNSYYLSAPPGPEYRWVRYGPDAVLVDIYNGEIVDVAYGVFYDGDQYGDDQGY